MTQLQKDIIERLFDRHTIAAYGNNYRLRDAKCNPVLKFTYKTYKPISGLLRKTGNGMYVLDLRTVRKQRGNSWVKKYYKQQNNN